MGKISQAPETDKLTTTSRTDGERGFDLGKCMGLSARPWRRIARALLSDFSGKPECIRGVPSSPIVSAVESVYFWRRLSTHVSVGECNLVSLGFKELEKRLGVMYGLQIKNPFREENDRGCFCLTVPQIVTSRSMRSPMSLNVMLWFSIMDTVLGRYERFASRPASSSFNVASLLL